MTRIRLLLAGLALAVAPLAGAAPPTDDQVQAAVAAFTERAKGLSTSDRAAWAQGRADAAAEALDGLSIAEMSLAQVQTIKQVALAAGPETRAAFFDRLATLADESGPAGAEAAVLRIDFAPQGDRSLQARLIAEAAAHPGLHAALRSEKGADIFSRVRSADPAALGVEAFKSIDRLLTPDLPAAVARLTTYAFEAAAKDDSPADAALRESIRTKAAACIGAAIETMPADDAGRRSAERSLAFLNGAFARGQLEGHPAPELTFSWSNASFPLSKLSDLKGKVVVLDFWATWCGPCVASFPNVRTLTKHYEGYPVVVLGVTSLQGYHYSRPPEGKPERIDTKDDPARETSLMPEFIKQLDMTWTVAFSNQDVFNPDYGVRGIPHVAIIDPAGVVRHRGMHPGSDLEGKIHKIDDLLKEFNLPVPAKPAEGEGATKAGS